MAIKTTQSTNRLRFIPLAFGSLLASWIVCAADLPSAVGQEKIEQLPEAGSVEEQREDLEIGGVNRTKYMGRRIADTMGYLGAPWLIRETRELEENPTVVLEQLGLKPGMSVCDLGCGNGFYTLLMAQKVGPTGKVYAVDIQPEMLQLLSRRAVEAKIDERCQIAGGEGRLALVGRRLSRVLSSRGDAGFDPQKSLARGSNRPRGVSWGGSAGSHQAAA
jgi:hypothetical protein